MLPLQSSLSHPPFPCHPLSIFIPKGPAFLRRATAYSLSQQTPSHKSVILSEADRALAICAAEGPAITACGRTPLVPFVLCSIPTPHSATKYPPQNYLSQKQPKTHVSSPLQPSKATNPLYPLAKNFPRELAHLLSPLDRLVVEMQKGCTRQTPCAALLLSALQQPSDITLYIHRIYRSQKTYRINHLDVYRYIAGGGGLYPSSSKRTKPSLPPTHARWPTDCPAAAASAGSEHPGPHTRPPPRPSR